ncbi:solute carrier family 22 member 23 [Pelobates cultripes]|uniref:Solute carrier family 22 member 23 n=1 Tax=Pelobates cultripes TaxID=61616 RepID=A0AAD1W0Z9_PELCU|nr:solute carrier family 22 member 23 [Pelobates cultripes]
MSIDQDLESSWRRQPEAEENGSVLPASSSALPPSEELSAAPPSPAHPGSRYSPLLLDYDGSVLPFLGGLGRFHKRLVLLTWIPALFLSFSQFSDSFLLDQPDKWCKSNGSQAGHGRHLPADNDSSAHLGVLLQLPAPMLPTTPAPSPGTVHPHNDSCKCHEWDYHIQAGLAQNVVSKWDLVCESSWKVHIAKFSLVVGLIFGYLITGCIADWVGRRLVLMISLLFNLVFGLSVALSVNVTMFSTLRFFEGFCLAGIFLCLYVLRIELCPPAHRFMITMAASFIGMAGQFLLPGIAALCRDWQILQAVIICPFILMLSYWYIFPESLRWLMATLQFETSKKQIIQIIHKNRVNTETDIKGVMTELEKELNRRPKRVCIVKVVGTRNLWKNIVVLCVNSLTGFGIHHCFAKSLMDPEVNMTIMHNFYVNYFAMAGIALASCLAMCPVVGFMGRRGGLLLFMILTALASLLQLGLLNLIGKYTLRPETGMSETVKNRFSIVFSIIGMFSSHAVGSLSVFFCAEITPTVIRGGGLGLVLASAGFGMLTAPIMELHNQKGYFLHHVIFACCTLICIICILLLPESKNQNLPENIPDGEHYTRQPLLPHKKGEQPLLLTNSELKDYSGLHDSMALGDSISENTTVNGIKST